MNQEQTARGLLDAETQHTLVFAGVTVGLLAFAALVFVGVAQATELPRDVFRAGLLALFLFGGLAVGAIVWTGLERGRGHVTNVVNAMLDAAEAETQHKFPFRRVNGQIEPILSLPQPAPVYPTLPLPDKNDEILYTANGRAGVPIARETIHGFEPRDLDWLCVYLANGNKWTETAMEKMPLPVSGEVMGKAQGNTPYARFMELCMRAGVIVERGGAGNKPGKLAVTDADEMYRLIKALPREDAA